MSDKSDKKFFPERMDKNSSKYEFAIDRIDKLDERENDIRSKFARDYTRILHCFGFRRLKHKTQVIFAPYNDHICTRLEHALYVASISQTISKELGLNTELVTAIAIGHDLGHAPFGHYGEDRLNSLYNKHVLKNNNEKNKAFWHEKHGLRVVDLFETVKDEDGFQKNLDLTYAVRDGIICHHGEAKFDKPIKPRDELIDLNTISKPGECNSYTWEGCVVKISDLISYLGRDLEDAELSGLIKNGEIKELEENINSKIGDNKIKDLCNGTIIHKLITDLCSESELGIGLTFSDDCKEIISQVYKFNKKHIYYNDKIEQYKTYIDVIIQTLFNNLKNQYKPDISKCIITMRNKEERVFRVFIKTWLERFQNNIDREYIYKSSENVRGNIKKPYNITTEEEYCEAVIDYLAGFTDNFAIRCFNEILSSI